jgi:hypothetical protein
MSKESLRESQHATVESYVRMLFVRFNARSHAHLVVCPRRFKTNDSTIYRLSSTAFANTKDLDPLVTPSANPRYVLPNRIVVATVTWTVYLIRNSSCPQEFSVM